MSLPILFLSAARREYDEASDWYESRQSGLGVSFTTAIQEILNRIELQPDFYALILRDVREAIVSRFPFGVYYQIEPSRIVIVAIFDLARDPSIWHRRIYSL